MHETEQIITVAIATEALDRQIRKLELSVQRGTFFEVWRILTYHIMMWHASSYNVNSRGRLLLVSLSSIWRKYECHVSAVEMATSKWMNISRQQLAENPSQSPIRFAIAIATMVLHRV